MASSWAWLKDKRVIVITIITLLALAMMYGSGVKFGIEFTGGTRIPITLEKAVSKTTMEEIVNNMKIRTTKFGLTQVVVRSVGDQRIDVEVSQEDPAFVAEIQKILKSEGKFEAIIDGRVAVTGNDIVSNSIREEPEITGSNIQWAVSFVITQEGAKRFGDTAYGKANYPVNLFLDRAEDTVILIRESDLFYSENFTKDEQTEAVKTILDFGNNTVIFIDDRTNETILASNKTKFILDSNETQLVAFLTQKNFSFIPQSKQDLVPKIQKVSQKIIVEEWKAIGLLSAPTLSPNLATGTAGQMYKIEGTAVGNTDDERREYAVAEMKKLKSILSGGALPVRIELGSAITVPPSLGKEFLNYSIVGIVAAAIAVAFIVLLRYRTLAHLLPLIYVSITQLVILVSVLGVFGTLDLSTIAGIFGALGSSVDTQMVVTDELLSRKVENKEEAKRRLTKSFYINSRSAIVLFFVLLPLLFSNIVEIIGFVTATVFGAILGVVITRYVYSAVIDLQ